MDLDVRDELHPVLIVCHSLFVEERLDIVADLAGQLHVDQTVIDELLQNGILFDPLYGSGQYSLPLAVEYPRDEADGVGVDDDAEDNQNAGKQCLVWVTGEYTYCLHRSLHTQLLR